MLSKRDKKEDLEKEEENSEDEPTIKRPKNF
jgi:hypothetical protein